MCLVSQYSRHYATCKPTLAISFPNGNVSSIQKKKGVQAAEYTVSAFKWNGRTLKLANMHEPLRIHFSRTMPKAAESSVVVHIAIRGSALARTSRRWWGALEGSQLQAFLHVVVFRCHVSVFLDFQFLLSQ